MRTVDITISVPVNARVDGHRLHLEDHEGDPCVEAAELNRITRELKL